MWAILHQGVSKFTDIFKDMCVSTHKKGVSCGTGFKGWGDVCFYENFAKMAVFVDFLDLKASQENEKTSTKVYIF